MTEAASSGRLVLTGNNCEANNQGTDTKVTGGILGAPDQGFLSCQLRTARPAKNQRIAGPLAISSVSLSPSGEGYAV